MKRCELCKSRASIHCESDRASLCWTCDTKVHSVNFLVARHSRNLLCRVCQSPTPWSASGEKLCRSTASVCGNCAVVRVSGDVVEVVGGNNGEIEIIARSSLPFPPAASSSSSEEFFGRDGGFLKRKRQEDEMDSSSVNINNNLSSSTVSSSIGTVGDRKKLRGRNIVSGEYVHAPVLLSGKSRRTVELDLNL